MGRSLVDRLMWAYWRSSRPFLGTFAEAVIGQAHAGIAPSGTRIIETLDSFMRQLPAPVFRQFIGGIFTLPLTQPSALPRNSVGRAAVKVWNVVRSHLARPRFRRLPIADRLVAVDTLFRTLILQAPEQEDDAVKTIVSLQQIKGVLCAAFMDDPQTWEKLDIQPFVPRTWEPPSGPDLVTPPRAAYANLLHQRSVPLSKLRTGGNKGPTWCVIGSGAGGGIAAHTILEANPHAQVMILESGPLVTNEAFQQQLLPAAARLFMNGSTTLSKDQLFTFRQGHCVGGSTTINNAVCIKPDGFWWDQALVARWRELGINLDWNRLSSSYDEVALQLGVREVEEHVLSGAAQALSLGFQKVGHPANRAPVNTFGCIGCGRCNQGCQYAAKRSILEAVLPDFVHRGGTLVPDAHVSELVFDESGRRLVGVRVADASGTVRSIEADHFVLAAGAYASTKLLRRSGYSGKEPGVRTVGRRFSVNLGSPLVGCFERPLRGWDGLQVGYVTPFPNERMVVETAFAPPGVFGMLAPQWGDAFLQTARRYNQAAVAVPVCASMAFGDIRRGVGESGFVIDFRMCDEDWRRLMRGMRETARAMFAMGADEVFDTRFAATSCRSADAVDRHFSGLGPDSFLRVESAHLQGGNVISPDPAHGVVDEQLKVHGVDNLWICDASVIPDPVTVNIQLTVMALSRYAAARFSRPNFRA